MNVQRRCISSQPSCVTFCRNQFKLFANSFWESFPSKTDCRKQCAVQSLRHLWIIQAVSIKAIFLFVSIILCFSTVQKYCRDTICMAMLIKNMTDTWFYSSTVAACLLSSLSLCRKVVCRNAPANIDLQLGERRPRWGAAIWRHQQKHGPNKQLQYYILYKHVAFASSCMKYAFLCTGNLDQTVDKRKTWSLLKAVLTSNRMSEQNQKYSETTTKTNSCALTQNSKTTLFYFVFFNRGEEKIIFPTDGSRPHSCIINSI